MNEVSLQGRIVSISKLIKSEGTACITFNIEIERTRLLPEEKSEIFRAKFFDYPKISAFDDLALKISKELKTGCDAKVMGWVHSSIVKTDSFNQYRTVIIADTVEVI